MKADGSKFGKTEGGAIWLDPALTSPYAFFQFWLNTDDRDVVGFLKSLTFLTQDQVDELEKATAEQPAARQAQRTLAQELTTLVHGADATAAVEAASEALFGRGDLDVAGPGHARRRARRAAGHDRLGPESVQLPELVDLLVATGLEKSRGEARRTIERGRRLPEQRQDRGRGGSACRR